MRAQGWAPPGLGSCLSRGMQQGMLLHAGSCLRPRMRVRPPTKARGRDISPPCAFFNTRRSSDARAAPGLVMSGAYARLCERSGGAGGGCSESCAGKRWHGHGLKGIRAVSMPWSYYGSIKGAVCCSLV